MARERRLSSARRRPSGRERGRPPACVDSYFPRFTALRLELGLSRHRLALRARDNGWTEVDEALLVRVETTGQRPKDSLIVGLAVALGRPADELRSMFEETA